MSGLLERCPRCSATVVGAAAWCTLCYADLTPPLPAPAHEPVRQPEATVPARAGRHSAPPVELPGEPADEPAAERATASGPSDADLQVMLAGLAAEDRIRLPRALGWSENRQVRVAVMIGGTLLVVLLSFTSLVVLGSIFG